MEGQHSVKQRFQSESNNQLHHRSQNTFKGTGQEDFWWIEMVGFSVVSCFVCVVPEVASFSGNTEHQGKVMRVSRSVPLKIRRQRATFCHNTT